MIMETLEQLDPNYKFKEKLAALDRDDLLSIIEQQNPKYIKQIEKIEYVFRNNLSHLNWDDGKPVLERDLTNDELRTLIDAPFIFSPEYAKLGFNEFDQQQIHVAADPVLWAREFLNAKPRAYQTLVLRDKSRKRVLRWGRRLGKTYALSIFILWYAFVNPDAKVLVVCPMKSHVGLIYEEIMKLIKGSEPMVKEALGRHVTSPQYEIAFSNGSMVRFFTSGMKSNSKTDVARGQEADVLVLDEMDYMGPEDLDALIAMMQDTNEDKTTEKGIIASSTPTGLRNRFWEYNTDRKYGYKAYWFPSYVNPNWTLAMEEEMRVEYKSEHAWRHEIEADWGESEQGVYPRRSIDLSVVSPGWDYVARPSDSRESFYTIGVDWDKYTAGVNITVLEVCSKDYEIDEFAGKIKVIYREEVSKGEFTYLVAMDTIIKLNEIFNPRHIYVDRGYGEVQLELFTKYGMDHPETQLHKRIKGIQFSEAIEVRDPFTKKIVKRKIKGFMIDNLYRMLEDGRMRFTEEDDELYFQLISYVVIGTTQNGEPKFGAGGTAVDHAHDSLILACLAISENYDELLNPKFGSTPKAVSNAAFLPMFSIESEEDKEIAEDKWGNSGSAPILARRSMTANVRRPRRPDAIRRKMF